MISKAESKRIRSLHTKKARQKTGLFLVEGAKNVREVLKSNWQVEKLLVSAALADEWSGFLPQADEGVWQLPGEEISRLSTLQTNHQALAVVQKRAEDCQSWQEADLVLALEGIRDPGNLGAIIRIADWYGIATVLCSPDTAEWYSPKTIAATMGSFVRVRPCYGNLAEQLQAASNFCCYGAVLDGINLHRAPLQKPALLVIGSESHGIGPGLASQLRGLSIPRFGAAESLNAAMAAAVFCDHFRRE